MLLSSIELGMNGLCFTLLGTSYIAVILGMALSPEVMPFERLLYLYVLPVLEIVENGLSEGLDSSW